MGSFILDDSSGVTRDDCHRLKQGQNGALRFQCRAAEFSCSDATQRIPGLRLTAHFENRLPHHAQWLGCGELRAREMTSRPMVMAAGDVIAN